MELYLLRHGLALDKDAWSPRPDRDRPLTREGELRTREVAKGMRALDLSFDRLITSPCRRALQTAGIVADVFRAKKKIEPWPDLAPDGDPRELIQSLSKRTWGSVLLIGHEPYLSRLISVLVAGDTGMEMTLKKAGLVKLSVGHLRYGRCAILHWLMPPKVLVEL